MSKLPDPITSPISPEIEEIYNELVSKRGYIYDLYRSLLNHPELARRIGDLGSYLRFGTGVLPGSVRELVILFIARRIGAAYEWVMHVPTAIQEGIPETVIEAIRTESIPQGLDQIQQSALTAVQHVLKHQSIPRDIQDELIKASGVKGVVELAVLCGFYQMIAAVIFAFDIPSPDGKAYPF
ncbi:MAG: carboxymuconolactone decarboxylase family protein [Proteobacteria bacterium]|nr:carboxymuconolactone decarboxylase family protein [Pseudomonadota bacterium]